MNKKQGIVLLMATVIVAGSYAESIMHNGTTINMNFVNIGYAGNASDSSTTVWNGSNPGAVGYNYRIGQKEVTIAQFAAARAADDRIGDGNEDYWNDGTRTVGTGAPASNVSAYDAMKFANYLTTGSAISGAYQFDTEGTTLLSVNRAAAVSAYGTVYVLPTEDEWYKAAYYKPVNDGSYSLYANGDGTVAVTGTDPTRGTSSGWNYYNSGFVNGSPNFTWETGDGGLEQNGTFDMMGNVREWNETIFDGSATLTAGRVIRGGSSIHSVRYLRSSSYSSTSPVNENNSFGFRVAAIPEPSSVMLMGMTGGFALFIRRRFRR